MDLPLVLECVMQRPRMLVGAAEVTARRFRATDADLKQRLISGTLPLWEW